MKLKKLIEFKLVDIKPQGQDKYNRILCYVYLQDGTCVNELMISEGFAFHLSKYTHKYLKKYERLESKAKRLKKGLWQYCY